MCIYSCARLIAKHFKENKFFESKIKSFLLLFHDYISKYFGIADLNIQISAIGIQHLNRKSKPRERNYTVAIESIAALTC